MVSDRVVQTIGSTRDTRHNALLRLEVKPLTGQPLSIHSGAGSAPETHGECRHVPASKFHMQAKVWCIRDAGCALSSGANCQRINKPTSLLLGHRPGFFRRGNCVFGHNPTHCHKAELVGGQIYKDRCGNTD